MALGDAEIGRSPSLPETRNRIESRDSRRDVVSTLKSSIRYLDSNLRNLAVHEDLAHPSDEYQRLSWIRESIGRNGGTFTNKFQESRQDENGQAIPTGREISLQEGIPVDDLLDYLKQKAEKLDWKNPKQAKEKQKLINQAHLLYRNSEFFYKVPGRFHTPPTEDEFSVIYSRKQQEVNLISNDYRATGNRDEDWKKAEDALTKRLELKLPKAPKRIRSPRSRPVSTSEPADELALTGEPEEETTLPAEPADELALTGEPEEETTLPAEPADELALTGEPEEETTLPAEPEPEPIPSPEPVIPEPSLGPSPKPQPITPEPTQRERISMDVVRADDVVDKSASLQSRKDIHERMGRHAFWKFWRWPEKIGLRLGQGGIENIQQERLRRASVTNNISFASLDMMRNAATAADQTKSEENRKSILERFRQGRIVERENNTQPIIEARKAVEGDLKTAIMQEVIKPIIDGEITGTPQEQANKIRERLTTFVRGHLTDPQVQELFGAEASDYGYVAEYFATDLLEKAQAVKEQMDKHHENLDQVSAYVDLHFGIARDQSNTDIRSFVDRQVANARRRQNERLARGIQEAGRISGWMLNPLAVGIAASLAANGLTSIIGTGGRVAGIAMPITGALGGGLVAGARRYIEIRGDRKMTNAEMSMGEVLPQRQHARNLLGRLFERTAGMYRREDLAQFRYDSVKVDDLINGTNGQEITNPVDTNNPPSKRKLDSVDVLLAGSLADPANRLRAIERMTEIQTRINRGKRNRVDLITFSDKTQVNQELNRLYDAVDRIKSALKDNSGLDDALISNIVSSETDRWMDAFDRDQLQKDQGFSGYQKRQAAGAAVFGAAMGLGGALGFQQGAAEIARHIPSASELPIFGGALKPAQTFIEKGLHEGGKALGHSEIGTGPVSTDSLAEIYNTGGRVDINDHITAQGNPDHTLTLIDRATGKAIPDQPQLWSETNGHMVTTGNPDQLPDEMKSWVRAETPAHSFQSQIEAATKTGKEEFLTAGKAHLRIEGQNVSVITVDDKGAITPRVGGTVDPNGSVLHLADADSDKMIKVHNELFANGFEGDLLNKSTTLPSALDHIKEIMGQPNPTTLNIKGVGEIIITPSSQDILIKPSIGELAGQTLTGKITPEGVINFSLPDNSPVDLHQVQRILEQAGFTGVKVEDIPGKTVTRNILEQFRDLNMVEKAKRLFWHDNSTPMHLNEQGILVGADGKELQFFHHLLKGDVVDLDMSKMVSQMTPKGGVNWDFTVDNQYNHVMNDIITNPDGSRTYKNFFFFITPNDAADNAREVIKIAVGPNGHAELPAGSDLHKFFDTSTGQPNQLARFIEVAHQEADGSRTILSTSVGKGIDNIDVPTPGTHTLTATPPNIKEIVPNYVYDATPPRAIDLTPPSYESAPAPPTPFSFRHPLKPLTPPLPPPSKPTYEYGYGAGNEESRRRLEDLTRETTSTEDENRLPGLLNQAFTLWGVDPAIQQNLRGLTPPEQLNWLRQQIGINQPAVASRANQLSIEEMANILTGLNTVRPTPTPPPTPLIPTSPDTTNLDNKNITNTQELLDYIADENNLKVPPEYKDDAIAEAQSYIGSSEIQNAETNGGLNQTESAALYKDMIIWRSSHNLTDLSKADSSFTSNPLYAQVTSLAEMGLWISDPDEVKRTANAIMRFINEYGNKYNITSKGDLEANLAVITIAFGSISKIPVASTTP